MEYEVLCYLEITGDYTVRIDSDVPLLLQHRTKSLDCTMRIVDKESSMH